MSCFVCGYTEQRAGYCLNCGSAWPGKLPPPGSAAPAPNERMPVPLIDTSEDVREGDGQAENIFITIGKREGFVPVVLWLGYTVDAPGVGSVPLHDVRIDMFARGAQGTQLYTLINDPTRYFTIASDGYHGLPVPFEGGGAEPYQARLSTGLAEGRWLFQVQWGYRPRNANVPGVLSQ